MKILEDRKYTIGGIIVFLCLIFIGRLFYIQVVDDSYKITAENNAVRTEIIYPSRGLIYDRKGELLVFNKAAYDLMIIPRKVAAFDSTDFCRILGIDKAFLRSQIEKAKGYSRYRPSFFLKQISAEQYAVYQEKMYKFPGFYVQHRTLREYFHPNAGHVLGYVGEVPKEWPKKFPYYKSGDYMGITGIESSYEEVLRGEKGERISLVDVHGRVKGPYKGGRLDKDPVSGKNLALTLDIVLQSYGEKLMQNKKGSIVAIEPKTGEILAMVSSPSYDPTLLVGRARSKNFLKLSRDTLEPLFNRALMARYPPGSTFKLVNALIGLEEGIISPSTHYGCNYGYHVGRFHLGCHGHKSPLDLVESIQNSCNAYYCNLFRDLLDNPKYGGVGKGFEVWKNHVVSFGFGYRLGSDFVNELRGFIPNSKYYDRHYGKGRWRSLMVVSLSIGQGEILVTPLQMSNMTAAIANKGHYYVPHIVKMIQDREIDTTFTKPHYTTIDSSYFDPIIEGMDLAVNGEAGSTARVARISDIVVCGKTGTAENPHGKDHSVFTAFAPKEDPKIAISVYVENGGFGATWAAPIASLMVEQYLKGEIDPSRKWLEKRILKGNLLERGTAN